MKMCNRVGGWLTLLAFAGSVGCGGSDEGAPLDAAGGADAGAGAEDTSGGADSSAADDASTSGADASSPDARIGADVDPAGVTPAPGEGAAEHDGDATCGAGYVLFWGERIVADAVIREVREPGRVRYTLYSDPLVTCATQAGADDAWVGYVETRGAEDPFVEFRLRDGAGGSFVFEGLTIDETTTPDLCFSAEHALDDEYFVAEPNTYAFGVIRIGGGFSVTDDCG